MCAGRSGLHVRFVAARRRFDPVRPAPCPFGRLSVVGDRRCPTNDPVFNAPSMTAILQAATSIFNPFVGVLALAIGVTLGARMLGRIVNLF